MIKRLDRQKNHLSNLLNSLRVYKESLKTRSAFVLEAALIPRQARLDSHSAISIKKAAGKVFGLGFLAVVSEFFFAEPISAATLGRFDVEVTAEEYDVFYAAVEMERDRLLSYLENSDDPEDRDLALEIGREIEAEKDGASAA